MIRNSKFTYILGMMRKFYPIAVELVNLEKEFD